MSIARCPCRLLSERFTGQFHYAQPSGPDFAPANSSVFATVAGQRGYDIYTTYHYIYLVVKGYQNAAKRCKLRNIVGWTGVAAAWPGCRPRRLLDDHERYAGT